MRTRSRIAVALVATLALHAGARLLVEDAALRVRRVQPVLPREAVEIALVTEREPSAAPAPSRARQLARTPMPQLAPEEAQSVALVDPHAAAAPAVAEDALAASPNRPLAEPRAPARPRSLLERVIAGTSGGPVPGLDVLDPSLRAAPDNDAARARRRIQALASAASARGAPPVDAGSLVEALVPLEGGGYRYATGGFLATIHVDGSVTFVDKDNRTGAFSSGLPGRDPDNLLQPYGPAIEPYARLDGAPVPRVMGMPLADNSTTLGSGSFDPTAALLRAQGQDPYEGEKLCFLEGTLPLRADLRVAHERAQMAGLRLHLEHLWFDSGRPAHERRAALFAAWDECREEEVGLLARELVASFIRQHLPAGSADAFTASELAAQNARRTSSARFAPYG